MYCQIFITTLLFAGIMAPPQSGKCKFLDQLKVPFSFKIGGIEIGGLSGLTYNPSEEVYYTVVDDGGLPFASFYTLRLGIDETGYNLIDIADSTPILKDSDGNTLQPGTYDPEAVTYCSRTDTLYWANEKDEEGKSSVRQMGLDGTFIRELTIPDHHIPDDTDPDVQTKGVLFNRGYQGLALLGANSDQLVVAVEAPLKQDGDLPTPFGEAPVRMLVYDILEDTTDPVAAVEEYVYKLDKIPAGMTDIGVAEIVRLNDKELLVLETAWNEEAQVFLSRIYRTTFKGATDVLQEPTVQGVKVIPMRKVFVKEISQESRGFVIDRLDHMAFGPDLKGKPLLLVGSDNDFKTRPRFTQSLAYTLRKQNLNV